MSHTILIVDDSATTRALIKRTLKLTDLPIGEIYEAGHGREALELLGCLKVDLILADLNMPEMNGFEMVRLIQLDASLRHIPVVLVSAEPNAESFALTHPGVRGVAKKPFTPEVLRDLLSAIMGAVHV